FLEVDPLLEAFARRLMAKKRDQRPANAKVARELLDLIERDRPAAAAALGVSLDVARMPQTTAPLAARQSGEAPPLASPGAVRRSATAPSHERAAYIATEAAWIAPVRRSRGWIVAAIGGAAAIGVAAFALTRSGGSSEPAKPSEPIAQPVPVV